jgi:hypothetical protein
MISLRDLGSPAVAVEWHEAVAVVAALTATLWNERAAQAPTLEAAVLTPDGDVAIVGDGRLAGAVTSGLALALGALLEATPCPAELRHIVTANVGPAPELDSVSAFARALMFFERPGRTEVLRDLAARADAALERARATEELERLTERARHRALQPAPAPREDAAPAAAPAARRFLAPAAVGLTVFLAVALAAATLFTKSKPEPEPVVKAGPVEDEETAAVEPAPEAAGRPGPLPEGNPGAEAPGPRVPVPPAGAAGAPRAGGAPAPTAGTRSAPPTEGAAPPGSGAGKSPDRVRGSDVDVRVTERGGAAVVPPASGGASRTVGRVFTAADSGVVAPILVKPHLPAEPPSDVPPWEVGTLELTVATSGAVEHVRLISPYNRYRERMLVAAAKAWLFQPATKDGRPVRFRTRIRVTL